MHNVAPNNKRLTSFIPGDNDSRNDGAAAIAFCAFCVVLFLASCASPTSLRLTANPLLNRVLAEAEDLMGTSYCSRGTTPDCFDCSGFTSWCFTRAGVTLPRSSKDQFAIGIEVHTEDLQPGDLIFFVTYGDEVSHVGIYAGDNTFVHSSTSKGVIVSSMHETYWRTRFVGARRILEQ